MRQAERAKLIITESRRFAGMTVLKKTILKITSAALALCVAGTAIYLNTKNSPKIVDNRLSDYFEITESASIGFDGSEFIKLAFLNSVEEYLALAESYEIIDVDADYENNSEAGAENSDYDAEPDNYDVPTGEGYNDTDSGLAQGNYDVPFDEVSNNDYADDGIPEQKQTGENAEDTTYPAGQDTGLFEINEFDMLMRYNGTDETVVIPDGVKEIADRAFDGNDYVQHIILPTTIIILSADAFTGCPNLVEITYTGNSEEWGNVYIAPEAIPNHINVIVAAVEEPDVPAEEETTAPAAEETTAEETTVPAADETTAEETTVPAADETTVEETTVPAVEETTAEETTVSDEDETTAEETTVPTSEETTSEETTDPAGNENVDSVENKTVSLVTQLSGINGVKTKLAARMSYFPTSAVVTITNTDGSELSAESALQLLDSNVLSYYAFDISIFDVETNEKVHKLNGNVKFSIGVPENLANSDNIYVYHINSGYPERLESEIVTNAEGARMVEFAASDFSPFVFTTEEGNAEITTAEETEVIEPTEIPEPTEESEETAVSDEIGSETEESEEENNEGTTAAEDADEPIIKVTFPASTSYIINPYHLDVKVNESESSNASIISPEMKITSESNCKVAIYMSAVAQNVPDTVRLSETYLTKGETRKTLFMYVEAANENGAYRNYFDGSEDQIVISPSGGLSQKLIELDEPEEGSYTDGKFKIFGETYMPNNDLWRADEMVNVLMVFRVEVVKQCEE